MQFFMEQTLPQMSTFFPDELWSIQVPRLAQSEPSIRHALIALSSYHELFTEHSTASPSLALRYYNLAIRNLVRDPGQTIPLLYTHVLSCALFICVEVRFVTL